MCNSLLREVARVPPATICSVNNFLSADYDETFSSHDGSMEEVEEESLLISEDKSSDTEEENESNNSNTSMPLPSPKHHRQINIAEETTTSKWLRHTLIVASPQLDVVAIASAQRFVILERFPSYTSSSSNQPPPSFFLEITAKVKVAEREQQIYISALSMFGIKSMGGSSNSCSNFEKRTTTTTTDWNCICVGLSNGQLLFYSQKGRLLFTEKCFASSPIVSIRLGPSVCPGNQELVLLSGDSRLVVIEGLSLLVALRAAFVYTEQGERTAGELSNMLQLNAQQLFLHGIRGVGDCQLAGPIEVGAFDQYVGAFLAGGRTEQVTRTQMPVYTQYVCFIGSGGGGAAASHNAGDTSTSVNSVMGLRKEREFVDFVWRSAQSTPGTLTDSIYSITSKLSNSIPSIGFRSFLGVGVSRADRPKKQFVFESASTYVYAKCSLRDGKRKAERTFLAPHPWNLVAVVDNVGRILLIHTQLRRILRIWKGYRQARCAWMECTGPAPHSQKEAKALFMLVFVPRRGLLEVWSMQGGPRVSAFEVDAGGRLLSLPSVQCGVLGEEIFVSKNSNNGCCSSPRPIFLSSDGLCYTVDVPFNVRRSSTVP